MIAAIVTKTFTTAETSTTKTTAETATATKSQKKNQSKYTFCTFGHFSQCGWIFFIMIMFDEIRS